MVTVYIYALVDPRNSDVRYVGLTRYPEKRLRNECHRAHNLHLRNWIAQLKGADLKPFMQIIEVSDESRSSCAERGWIAFYRENGANLLNFTTGGEHGFAVSEETKQKQKLHAISRKRKPLSAEHRAAISRGNKGKPRPWGAANILKFNKSCIGKTLSEEHKRKVSESVKKSMTDEVRAKMSASHKGRAQYTQTAETRANVAVGMKRWHETHHDEFMATIQRRGMVVANDPHTGRFVPKS